MGLLVKANSQRRFYILTGLDLVDQLLSIFLFLVNCLSKCQMRTEVSRVL